MKPLFGNRKSVISILGIFIFVLGINATGYALPVSQRTPQVRDAIVAAVPGVNSANNVTKAHLAAITELDLSSLDIPVLKSGDFDGLTALTTLNLQGNDFSTLPAGVFDDLTALSQLRLNNNGLTFVPSGIFENLTELSELWLADNKLRSLPDGIFEGLNRLRSLSLGGNAVNPMPISVSLEKIADGQFKAVVPTGAPFDIVLPLTVTNGSVTGGTTNTTIAKGDTESGTLTVTRTPGTTAAVAVNIGTLPGLPSDHSGYTLVKSDNLPLRIINGDIADTVTFTMTVGTIVSYGATGFHRTSLSRPFGSVSPQTFTFKGITYTVNALYYRTSAVNPQEKFLSFITSPLLPRGFELYLDSQQFNSAACNQYGYGVDNVGYNYWYNIVNLNWSKGQTVRVRIIEATPILLHAPINLQATTHFKDVTLTWEPPVNADPTLLPVDEYELRISDDGGTTWAADWDDIDESRSGQKNRSSVTISRYDSPYTFYTFSNGTVYTFEVRAKGGDGPGDAARVTLIMDGITSMSERTPQVRDAIVAAVPGVNSAADVTEAHLAAITRVSLSWNVSREKITSLKVGDFSGLTSLEVLWLSHNSLTSLPEGMFNGLSSLEVIDLLENNINSIPSNMFKGLTSLKRLDLQGNRLTSLSTEWFDDLSSLETLSFDGNALTELPTNIFDRLISLKSLDLGSNSLTSLSADVFERLSTLTHLDLRNASLTSLPTDIFDGLSLLSNLDLGYNKLSNLPIGIFDGLSSLTQLQLSGNAVSPMPINISLKKVADRQFKAVVPTGAPFDIVLPVSVTNGSMSGGATSITISKGSVESGILTVTRTSGAIVDVTVNIGTLPGIPTSHQGYALHKSTTDLPLTVIPAVANNAPVFTDGTSTTRSIAENTAAGQNIGTAIAATDADTGDVLTYTLGGTDAAAFEIDATTGQLKTKAALDYETKTTYTVTVTVSDGNGGSDSITVAISVIDVNDTIIVPVGVPVASRTSQVRDAIIAAIPGVSAANQVTAAHLAAITSLNLRSAGITALQSDDFSGMTALTSLNLFNNQLSNLPPGIFEGLTSLTTIRLGRNAIDPLPLTVSLEKVGEGAFKAVAPAGATFNYILPITVTNGTINGGATTLTIPHGSVESGTLTVTRTAGTTGHVTVDIAAFPGLPRTHYGYALTKSDHLPLEVIRGINRAPVFSDGTTATRTVALPAGIPAGDYDIGAPIIVTDPDGDTMTHTLGGPNADLFHTYASRTANGAYSLQLTTRGKALHDGTGATYSVIVTVSDTSGTSRRITVTINVTDVNGNTNTTPTFTDGTSTTRSIAENTAAGIHIGTAITATDADNDTLTYTLGGTDAASFDIDATTGQLKTKAALDYETKNAYTVTVTASDGSSTNTITVTINITDANELPASTGVCKVGDVLASGQSCTYPGTDETFSVNNNGTGQFLFFTAGTSLNIQNTELNGVSYTLVAKKLASGSWEIEEIADSAAPQTTNTAPVFTDGATTTRSIAENTAAGQNIGTAIAATDADNDTLTYTLSGTDAAVFSIVSTTGQLQTNAALDYETKNAYAVTITVADGEGGSASITVTINVTDVNENRAPVFSDGATTTRTVALPAGIPAGDYDIGAPIIVTDPDGDTMTHTLGGPNADLFHTYASRTANGAYSLQLTTRGKALHDGTGATYTVIYTVSDASGASSRITVTITVTDVNELPTTTAICKVGDVLKPGQSCTYPGTDAVFSVLGAGTAQWHIPNLPAWLEWINQTAVSGSLRISTTVNGQAYHFVAEQVGTSWEIKEIGDDRSDPQPETPEVPEPPTVTEKPIESDYDHIEGPWLWMIAPGGDIDMDNLSEASEGVVTETQIAQNGINEGDHFNDLQWTSGRLLPTKVCGFFLCSSDNVINVVREIGLTDKDQLSSYSAYALINISSPRDQNDVLMGVGSDDSIKVWLNGSVVYKNDISRRTTGIQNRFPVNLNAGDNLLLIKVCNHGALWANNDWGMFFKIYLDTQDYTVSLPMGDGNSWQPVPVVDDPTNTAPVFTDGTRTTRTIAENTASRQHIGTAITATDADNDTLTYRLTGTDASSFSIDSTTGQLKTRAALDYETKNAYTVTITVSDGSLTDVITVNINVTDINEKVEDDTNPQLDTPEQPGNTGGTPTLSVSTTAPLIEATLHEGIVTLTLTDGTYESSSWRLRDAVSVAGITGIALDRFATERISDTKITVKLEFDGNINTDSTLTLTVGAGAIADYNGAALTAQIPVTAVSESITASTAAPLTEATLDESVVTLTLSGRKFERWNSAIRPAVSVSGISGVTVRSFDIDRESDTEVTVELTFNGNMNTDGTLTFTVGADAIAGYNGPALTAQVTVTADRENALLVNFPNPFNPETWIPYQLAKPVDVSIGIYAIDGKLVRTLDLGLQAAGMYQTRSRAAYWDGRNAFGEPVASGVYFYTLTAGDFTATRKMSIRK